MRQLLIFIIIVMLSGSIIAQDDDTVINPDLSTQLQALEATTSTLRGLDELAPIAIDFPTRPDVLSFLETVFADYYTEEVITSETAFYRAFGFIPDDYELVPELANLLGEQVAGYYDTETQVMNVILSSGGQPDDYLPFLDRAIYVHEYVHALQDQHFDLDAFYLDIENSNNVDAILARQALVEGDATLIMSNYTIVETQANPLGVLLEMGTGILELGNVSIPADTPSVISEELTFPYLTGEQFVRALYAVDGWETVNTAYTVNPPQSTEHILHPQTYLEGDNPLTVTVLDNSNLLGADWSFARTGVFGEFYLREWLTMQNIDEELIDLGATGWGGDAYRIYQHTDGRYMFELKIEWDTAQDREEFYTQTLASINGILPLAPSINTVDISQACTVREDETLCFMLSPTSVTITSAPDFQLATTLLNN